VPRTSDLLEYNEAVCITEVIWVLRRILRVSPRGSNWRKHRNFDAKKRRVKSAEIQKVRDARQKFVGFHAAPMRMQGTIKQAIAIPGDSVSAFRPELVLARAKPIKSSSDFNRKGWKPIQLHPGISCKGCPKSGGSSWFRGYPRRESPSACCIEHPTRSPSKIGPHRT
jgi:hypothetical protein